MQPIRAPREGLASYRGGNSSSDGGAGIVSTTRADAASTSTDASATGGVCQPLTPGRSMPKACSALIVTVPRGTNQRGAVSR